MAINTSYNVERKKTSTRVDDPVLVFRGVQEEVPPPLMSYSKKDIKTSFA